MLYASGSWASTPQELVVQALQQAREALPSSFSRSLLARHHCSIPDRPSASSSIRHPDQVQNRRDVVWLRWCRLNALTPRGFSETLRSRHARGTVDFTELYGGVSATARLANHLVSGEVEVFALLLLHSPSTMQFTSCPRHRSSQGSWFSRGVVQPWSRPSSSRAGAV